MKIVRIGPQGRRRCISQHDGISTQQSHALLMEAATAEAERRGFSIAENGEPTQGASEAVLTKDGVTMVTWKQEWPQ